MSSSAYKSRSRSPHRHEEHRSREPRGSIARPRTDHKALPLGASPLSRHDLEKYRPLFALYMDIQKSIDLDDLSQDEVRGRWKSFMGKWNRGELAEGWYDVKTLEKAINSVEDDSATQQPMRYENVSDDDDNYGPAAPEESMKQSYRQGGSHARAGPAVPNMQELRARREQADEDAVLAREQRVQDLQLERKSERKQQNERANELIPRAEPGTRERQLEKKRELADSNRSFAASKDAADVEIRDSDLMGDEDSLAQVRRMQKEQERKKTEREIRREETLRARNAEREERLVGMREKEAKTMDMLKEIAKARFGA